MIEFFIQCIFFSFFLVASWNAELPPQSNIPHLSSPPQTLWHCLHQAGRPSLVHYRLKRLFFPFSLQFHPVFSVHLCWGTHHTDVILKGGVKRWQKTDCQSEKPESSVLLCRISQCSWFWAVFIFAACSPFSNKACVLVAINNHTTRRKNTKRVCVGWLCSWERERAAAEKWP